MRLEQLVSAHLCKGMPIEINLKRTAKDKKVKESIVGYYVGFSTGEKFTSMSDEIGVIAYTNNSLNVSSNDDSALQFKKLSEIDYVSQLSIK